MTESNYISMLQDAIDLSTKLEIRDIYWKTVEYKYQSESEALEVFNIVNGELFDFIEANFYKFSYWGNMCLDLSVATYCFLRAKGYDAELIYGNLNVNGSPDDEFDATIDSLSHEFINKINEGEQNIHAWVGLGGDIIIDFALMPRLIKNYEYPSNLGDVIVGPASYLLEKYKLNYKPILVGSGFFKDTNAFDPQEMLRDIKNKFKT